MAETTAADTNLQQPNTPLSTISGADQTYYECGAGRKLFFSFAFILLLPFYISLPAMLFQRISSGLWVDTWQLSLLAVLFTILMALIVFELIFSLRAKVDIGEKSVAFTLPSGGGGTVPVIFYESRDIPYEDIQSVEQRCEILGGRYAPMMMCTVRLILKDGETIMLGRTNEKDDDPKFPFPIIAQQIAKRVGEEVVDRGNVMMSFPRRILGLSDQNKLEPEQEIAQLNSQHNVFLVLLSTLLVILLLLGIAGDFIKETTNNGERARNSVVLQ